MSTSAVGSSGQMIDVNGIVSGLMAIEQRPLVAIKSKVSATQVSVSSMSEVKGLVDAAYSAASSLNSAALLNGKSAASSSDALVKVSVTDSSLAGTATIPIRPVELARAQRSTLAGFSSATTVLPSVGDDGTSRFGTLTIGIPSGSSLLSDGDGDGVGDAFSSVSITMGGKTLTEIRDDVNSQLAGKVTASIINTGSSPVNYVLVLSGAKTGADADFTIALDDATVDARAQSGLLIGSMLAAQASQSTGNTVSADLSYDAAADDAYAELYSGTGAEITVRSASNAFSNVIPGLRFELMKKPVAGDPVSATVTVSENTAEIESKLTSFASSFSDLIKRLRVLTAPGTDEKKAGPLASNAGVLSLTSSLLTSYSKGLTFSDGRTYTTASGNVVGAVNSPLSWSSLGLKMARDGTVSLDTGELRSTLASGLGDSLRQGFEGDLISVLNSFRGANGGLQGTIQTIELSLSSLKTRQSEIESRIERTRQGLVKKYAALDAKLVQMNQMSTNVRSALAGLVA